MIQRVISKLSRSHPATINPLQDHALLGDQVLQTLQQQNITLDDSQQQAICSIQQLFIQDHSQKQLGVLIWGGVGTGKTLIMNAFYEQFNGNKIRYHILELYQQLMQQMHINRHHSNPTQAAIAQLSCPQGVIFIDDFYLRDIADAKLWQSIFNDFVHYQQRLILTSNQRPNDIMVNAPSYKQQIQQLIDNMNHYLHAVQVDIGIDYRQQQINAYHNSQYALIQPQLYATFIDSHIRRTKATPLTTSSIIPSTHPSRQQSAYITIQSRQLAIVAEFPPSLLVLSFDQLFNTERSFRDYLELVNTYQTLCLIDYPLGLFANNTVLQRLIWFIDVVYDNPCQLFWFVEAMPLADLQTTNNDERRRCLSRLKQMFRY